MDSGGLASGVMEKARWRRRRRRTRMGMPIVVLDWLVCEEGKRWEGTYVNGEVQEIEGTWVWLVTLAVFAD